MSKFGLSSGAFGPIPKCTYVNVRNRYNTRNTWICWWCVITLLYLIKDTYIIKDTDPKKAFFEVNWHFCLILSFVYERACKILPQTNYKIRLKWHLTSKKAILGSVSFIMYVSFIKYNRVLWILVWKVILCPFCQLSIGKKLALGMVGKFVTNHFL